MMIKHLISFLVVTQMPYMCNVVTFIQNHWLEMSVLLIVLLFEGT